MSTACSADDRIRPIPPPFVAAVRALLVHVADRRRWFIPADALEPARRSASGAPEYSEFEIEPGPPLPARTL
jgi:hypothetical protein